MDEQLQRTTNSAGEQEVEGEAGMYATEVIITIVVPSGDVYADTKKIAKDVATFRAMEAVPIKGNAFTVEYDAHVNRIGE